MNMIVSASAVASATLAPARAEVTDPVYAAIEGYKASYVYYGECLDKKAKLEEGIHQKAAAIAERRMRTRREFEAANPDQEFAQTQEKAFDRFRYLEIRKMDTTAAAQEAERLEQEGGDACAEAAWVLARTIPTSAAGAATMIAFLRQCEDDGDEVCRYADDDNNLLGTVAMASIETFIRRGLT